MLCDRVLGNVESDPLPRYAGKSIDPLHVSWRDCTRRALRGRSDTGRSVSLLLPLGVTVGHGDVLVETATELVVVMVEPCEVWVAAFADARSLATAALELGNLHAAVEVSDGRTLVTPPDGPSRGVLDRYAATWRAEARRFAPLRATVAGGVRIAAGFQVTTPQLTNSRE